MRDTIWYAEVSYKTVSKWLVSSVLMFSFQGDMGYDKRKTDLPIRRS